MSDHDHVYVTAMVMGEQETIYRLECTLCGHTPQRPSKDS